jgi:hypothetical protein
LINCGGGEDYSINIIANELIIHGYSGEVGRVKDLNRKLSEAIDVV